MLGVRVRKRFVLFVLRMGSRISLLDFLVEVVCRR